MKQELLPCPWCGGEARNWVEHGQTYVCCESECEPSSESAAICGIELKQRQSRAPDARVQLLTKALREIARNSDESNEWDAVDKLHENEDKALEALKEAGMEG